MKILISGYLGHMGSILASMVKDGVRGALLAGGVDKTRAIYAALEGRIIDSLITDSRIAEKLLALDDTRQKSRKGAGYDR